MTLMSRFYLFIALFVGAVICIPFTGQAQDAPTISYESPQEFEIGGIKVSGATYSDEKAIVSIAGLRVGQKVRVPGPDITKALRALWKLKLFTDIEILVDKIVGDVVFLEIQIREQPRLSRYDVVGSKSTYEEDIEKEINNKLIIILKWSEKPYHK